MKTGEAILYPNDKVAERVTAYSAGHSTPLPKHITEFHADIVKNHEKSVFLTSNFQSQCNVLLARMIGAKRGGFPCFTSPTFLLRYFAWGCEC